MKTKTYNIYLGKQQVGYLTNYQDGKNLFSFSEEYIELGPKRPTLSLAFNDISNESITLKKLSKTYASRQKLPVFFSNLLPEGGLKDYIVDLLQIHDSHEFSILEYLKHDLPGNVALEESRANKTHPFTRHSDDVNFVKESPRINFSLAGVQIKFSMLKEHEHYTLSRNNHLPDWIIKTPSIVHPQMPENEYCMMQLAKAVGVNIPDVKLVSLSQLSLPRLNLPKEQYAYAIKRFDRMQNTKIHAEDFAQVLNIRSHEKYTATNYDSMTKIISTFTKNSYQDVLEFIRRIIVNILIANTDAHLKNFVLIYPDGRIPWLAPAYDLISSLGYIKNTELALNLARVKNFYQIDESVFQRFAKRIDLSSKILSQMIDEVLSLAQQNWPSLLKDLPLPNHLLLLLQQHWKHLKSPLKLEILL